MQAFLNKLRQRICIVLSSQNNVISGESPVTFSCLCEETALQNALKMLMPDFINLRVKISFPLMIFLRKFSDKLKFMGNSCPLFPARSHWQVTPLHTRTLTSAEAILLLTLAHRAHSKFLGLGLQWTRYLNFLWITYLLTYYMPWVSVFCRALFLFLLRSHFSDHRLQWFIGSSSIILSVTS